MDSWDAKYDAFLAKQAARAGTETAADLEVEEHEKRLKFENFLQHTLSVDDRVDWSALKSTAKFKRDSFSEPMPRLSMTPEPTFENPTISFFQKLFGKAKAIQEQAENQHEEAITQWKSYKKKREDEHESQLAKWKEKRSAFEANQVRLEKEFNRERDQGNSAVDALRESVDVGREESVLEHASMVLEASNYFDLIEKDFELDYEADRKTLLVEFHLPTIDSVPDVKTIRFVKSTGELKETKIAQREIKSIYDSACYQIALRTLHELYEADEADNFANILFNGTVAFVDPATGQRSESCIMSVLVEREAFLALNLASVDPKACFKSLKGVSAATMASYTAVPPIMKLNKEDKRFIEGQEVIEMLPEDENLAAMSWEDFEHLIREIFEKEFARRGGEVKVTKASRDGGVDAIAFDPDPISGGKIVIQAKRYTRTVGVSAIRDLYGTVMNEGANKGIIVTTADYGPDAYHFASDKPLSLLSGSNLLHMLEQHGYKAKIDLAEARRLNE